MASVTVRNIDDDIKQTLRMRAARNGKSLEEEIRVILRQIADEERRTEPAQTNLYDAIRKLVEPHGGFDMNVPPRVKSTREPPTFE